MPWEGTCCGVMLREGVWGQDHPWVPKSSTTSGHTGSALGGQGAPWDRDTLLWGLFPLPTPWGPISPSLSHSTVHPLPHQGSQALLFTFQMGNKLQPSLCTQKKPNQTPKNREERNKQTNPFPLLAWHLLAALALLIREAAGIISNKPLLMKFRAADPGGAPRHRFSETLIKFSARRCIWLGEAER